MKKETDVIDEESKKQRDKLLDAMILKYILP